MTSSKNLHFYPTPLPPASSSVITTQPPPPSEQKMTSSWPDPPPPPLTFIFFRFMLFKIDKHLSSILIAKGDKPAQKISYEELSAMEKLISDLTAVGLSDVYTRGNKN